MSSLRNTDRIDKQLFRRGSKDFSFDVSITNLMTNKTSDDVKLDPIYVNKFDSSKYSNVNKLNNVRIYTSAYLTLNYVDYANNEYIENIFISPQYMFDFNQFLKELYDMVSTNRFFSKNNTVKPEMKEEVIQSNTFGASEKIVWAYPTTLRDQDNRKIRACNMCINSEECVVTLTEDDIYTLYSVLYGMNGMYLQLFSDIMTLQASVGIMSGTGFSSIGSNDEEDGGGRPPRRGRGGFGRRKPSGVSDPRRKRSLPMDDDEEMEEIDEEETEYVEDADEDVFDSEDDEEEVKPARKKSKSSSTKKKSTKKKVVEEDDEDEEEERPVRKKSTKKTSSKTTKKKSTSSSKKRGASLDDIINEAEDMEYDDIDFEEDDE